MSSCPSSGHSWPWVTADHGSDEWEAKLARLHDYSWAAQSQKQQQQQQTRGRFKQREKYARRDVTHRVTWHGWPGLTRSVGQTLELWLSRWQLAWTSMIDWLQVHSSPVRLITLHWSVLTITLWRPTVAIWVQLKSILCLPNRVKPSFVIFDIRALWRSDLSVRVPGCQKLQMTA